MFQKSCNTYSGAGKMAAVVGALMLTLTATSQDCSCATQFSFVKNYFERNNPAFQKIKHDDAAFAVYTKKLGQLTAKVRNEKSNDRCNIFFEEYIALLKDHHSRVDLNLQRLNIDLTSAKAVDSFKATPQYQSFKKMAIDTTELFMRLASKSQADVQGIYTNQSGLTLGIVATGPNDYAGVVMRQNKLLDVGHILFEFKKKTGDSFDCVYHTGLLAVNFQNVYRTLRIKDGKIPEVGLSKTADGPAEIKLYEMHELDKFTNYLKLKSFDRSLKQGLDSFYHSIDSAIQSKPYLIIDLRDNGGGAEECYFDLMKYIYTDPLETDEVEVWVTPDNIKRYEETGYSQKLINRMKQTRPFTFIPQIENASRYWTMTGTDYPKEIAILFNRITASAAEGLVTYAMQSRKVITLGENSGGYIGYGDVMTAIVPCNKFLIKSTTTKYHKNSRYEFVGIKPMYPLSADQDWVKAALVMLQKS